MGQDYGRNRLAGQIGTGIQVTADGAPEWLVGGATLDWSTIIPVAVDTDPGDGNIIQAGHKGLRYGTILVREASGYYAPWTHAAAATALAALAAPGAVALTLTSSANIYPGDTLRVSGTESVEVATVPDGTHVTLVAPTALAHANADAVTKPDDDRQDLVIGQVGILNDTLLEDGPLAGLIAGPTAHHGLIVGGRVWAARLLVGGADQPTLAALLAAMPRLVPVLGS